MEEPRKELLAFQRKAVAIINGEPVVQWTEEEVKMMNVIENIQYAIVEKFNNVWPSLEEIRTIIPRECGIKRGCQIGHFRHRHVLIRCQLLEDFVAILARNAYYFKTKEGMMLQIRPLIYDEKIKVDEETTQTIAWVSFPNLMPTLFGKDTLFTLASVVGRTL
ncbi:hypothetical protein HAX54_033906 [Datura stramonium]|uniref:DUF4283 domain-containing protein n=1 Tax=Datura stramonium TaxID=4076 RepID=A0ABS8VER0_DATST|nr:hypothetical protein [Datura stramonium]